MYHDRYTRRRAADSFHEDDEDGGNRDGDEWSWALFVGVIVVQITSRSVWASFGVISIFILGDQGPSWMLLATPLAFAISWGLTEPWIKKFCKGLGSATEFMYIVVTGAIIAWFGVIVSVKTPITLSYLVPLLGVVGGCGSNIMATATTSLVRRHFPSRSGLVRFFEQVTASLSFLVMPLFSYFAMESFGDHGGLLIHSGVLMQGFVGGSLLGCAKWKSNNHPERRPRSYAFIYEEDDAFLPQRGDEEEDEVGWVEGEAEESPPTSENKEKAEIVCEKYVQKSLSGHRIAFGLRGTPDTPPERRRRRKSTLIGFLPSIQETAEEEEEDSESKSSTPSSGSNDFSPDHNRFSSPVNTIPKPPRTFEHRFSSEKLVISLDAAFTEKYFYETPNNQTGNIQERTGVAHKIMADTNCVHPIQDVLTQIAERTMIIWHALKRHQFDCKETWDWLSNPFTVPAAFLLYSTQSSLVVFLALTPVLLDEYVDAEGFSVQTNPEISVTADKNSVTRIGYLSVKKFPLSFVMMEIAIDGTRMDGAYCVSVMGFTWLCFVLASLCFSTIHSSNHQSICVIALVCSSLTLFMISRSSTLDEMVLYSSLFGLSYGIARMTSYSILKMCFGRSLNDLWVHLSVIASFFNLIFMVIVVLSEWCHHLKNIYKVQVLALLCSALFWMIQGCVNSVRSKRGRHEFTWSRRRRVS